MQEEISYIKESGYEPFGTLNFSTSKNGIDYFIGTKGDKAIVVALNPSEDNFLIEKEDAREMADSAKLAGIKHLELHTNYGVELHSRHEKPKDIRFDKVVKIVPEFAKGGVTMSDLNSLIRTINEEGGGEFTLSGAYGYQELWARDKDGGNHRIEVGSKKDIYQTLIKNRYNKKYNPNYDNEKFSTGGLIKGWKGFISWMNEKF